MRIKGIDGKFCSTPNPKYHKGYKVIYMPEHHRAKANGYVYEHILIVEKKIGRNLIEGEVVHHIDGDKLNNHPDNLMVFPSQSEHNKWHWKTRGKKYKLCDGREMTVPELAELVGVKECTVYQRIRKLKWTADEVVEGKRRTQR